MVSPSNLFYYLQVHLAQVNAYNSMAGALNKLPVAVSGMIFFDAPVTFFSVTAVMIGTIDGFSNWRCRLWCGSGICNCEIDTIETGKDGSTYDKLAYTPKECKQSKSSWCRESLIGRKEKRRGVMRSEHEWINRIDIPSMSRGLLQLGVSIDCHMIWYYVEW